MDVLGGLPQRRGDVLVVDQCEEVLAPEVDPDERTAFLAALADIAGRGPLVLTLRADRLGEVSRYAGFAHLVERGLHLLGPMEADALRRAIEGPAEQAGLRLEPGLVDLLVREVEGAPGALPLLSHVLRQTWTRREGNTLTVAGYTATGGIQEAVSQSAETVFRGMTGRQQDMLRDLMLRLVVPSDSGDPVRTRAPRRSVAADEEHEAVIESLVGARLLSSDGDSVEIAHEALAVAWPRLRSWLDDDVEGLRIMRHLAVAADSWEELGRPPGELYRGPRQANAQQWRSRSAPTLTPSERDFLDASAALAEAEARATEEQVRLERRSNRRLRWGLTTVAALLAVALVAGLVAVTSARRADQEAASAEQQAKAADARRLGAEALRSIELDRALLLAVAGTELDDTPDTKSNLSAVLGRNLQLLDSTRSDSTISISISPDGRTLATAGMQSGVHLLDPATLEEKATNGSVPLRKVQFSPDGTKLFASVNPFSPTGLRRVDPIPLRVLDPLTAELADTQLGGMPDGRTLSEAFSISTDGRWLGAAFLHPKYLDNASHVRVWDMRHMSAPVASFTVPYLASQLAVSPDGTRLFITGGGEVHALDVSKGREVGSAPVTDELLLALTPDGKKLAVQRDTDVALLDPQSLSVTSVLANEGIPEGDFVVSADGTMIAYAVDGILLVRPLADPETAGTRLSIGNRHETEGIAFAKDMRTVYEARGDGLTLALDAVGDRQLVRPMPLQPRPGTAHIQWARISPDRRTVANLLEREGSVAILDGQGSFAVQFLDVASGTWTKPSDFFPNSNLRWDIAWDRAGRQFATAWGGQSVRVWDPRTARLVAEYRVPEDHGVTTTTGFSGDGSRIVVGTDEGWLHTFSTSSGRSEGRPVHVGPRDAAAPGGPGPQHGCGHRRGPCARLSGRCPPPGGPDRRHGGQEQGRPRLHGPVVRPVPRRWHRHRGRVRLHLQVFRFGESRPVGQQPGGDHRPSDTRGAVGSDEGRRLREPQLLPGRSPPDRQRGQIVSLTATEGGDSLGSLRLGDDGIGGAFFTTAAFTADEKQRAHRRGRGRTVRLGLLPSRSHPGRLSGGRSGPDGGGVADLPPRARTVRRLPALTRSRTRVHPRRAGRHPPRDWCEESR